ncbi:L-aminoadipate-semialdehyde dehydrogenase-phosphopantetheinyl transferase (4'-phosphopantetheinyl transferase) (Alpha-aminoadipic semialdehyde dehydrogenase-phosphopantetheinyl transferase) (AASD-PPT) [Durusdinium trenchii]|uniref:holo-[acyl-carrier-protein] synthase n=1 Tax=Durusdinium trenchii TaxID=1381693 RepID=A0ABP0P9N5_9DINO
MPLWVVVGGADKGGILVRRGQELSSAACTERLSTGAEVEQLHITGERLHYRRILGSGPEEGWVSVRISGKELLTKKEEKEAEEKPQEIKAESKLVLTLPVKSKEVVGPSSGYTHRWAINIDDWNPAGGSEGSEFQFLLRLIKEENERKAVLRFKFLDDQKRALISRLLVRQASASSLNKTNFDGMEIKRTKGRKPFLAHPLCPENEAPNWNVNCSHEGKWVVMASEGHVIAGIDVAELRRTRRDGEPIDFHDVFKDNLTFKEWEYVKTHGPCPDKEYEAFSRFWSAKEAFVKARGDGLAYPLGKAEFHWKPLDGYELGTAFEGDVHIEGAHSPKWRFVQYRMPGDSPHWTTVGRGPLTDIVDAHGEFKKTLRKPQELFSDHEWEAHLNSHSPHFDVLPISALVPQDNMAGYIAAGGISFP